MQIRIRIIVEHVSERSLKNICKTARYLIMDNVGVHNICAQSLSGSSHNSNQKRHRQSGQCGQGTSSKRFKSEAEAQPTPKPEPEGDAEEDDGVAEQLQSNDARWVCMICQFQYNHKNFKCAICKLPLTITRWWKEQASLNAVNDQEAEESGIRTWLTTVVRLPEAVSTFMEEGWDTWDTVRSMTIEDIQTLDIKGRGNQRKLYLAIQTLNKIKKSCNK